MHTQNIILYIGMWTAVLNVCLRNQPTRSENKNEQDCPSNLAIGRIAAGQRVVQKIPTSASGQWERWSAT